MIFFDNEKLKKVEYPIIKPDSDNLPLKERIIWKNLFKIRISDLIFIITIIILLITFKIYIYETNEMLKHPCKLAVLGNCSEMNITIERAKIYGYKDNNEDLNNFFLKYKQNE